VAQSLPAIRFNASSLKVKFWKRWREAMPRVLQLKEARELDRKTTLGKGIFLPSLTIQLTRYSAKAVDKWVQTYRTKIALKAVA
jgi:protein SFI1